MMARVGEVSLIEESDKVVWKLKPLVKFSTRSIHRYITFAGVTYVHIIEIWKAKIPLKAQIFLCMA